MGPSPAIDQGVRETTSQEVLRDARKCRDLAPADSHNSGWVAVQIAISDGTRNPAPAIRRRIDLAGERGLRRGSRSETRHLKFDAERLHGRSLGQALVLDCSRIDFFDKDDLVVALNHHQLARKDEMASRLAAACDARP